MVTGNALDPLEDVLGGPGSAALLRWAQQQRRTVRLTNPRWTARGYTGAVLAAIVVSTPGDPDRQVIVKVCPAGPSAEESGAHREARARSERRFFERHLVDQAYEPHPIDGGGRLMFQEIAGATLDYVTLSGVPDAQLAPACATVVAELIRRWNPALVKSVQTSVGEYLFREFARTASGGSAEQLAASLGLYGPEFRYLRDGVGQMPVDIPNPLLMFTDEVLAAQLPIDAVVGLAHGDLHTENVLIPKTFDTPQIDEFRLVDLSTFEVDAPVTRDPVTLMLSVIAPSVAELRPEEQDALLAFVLAPRNAPPRLSALLAKTIEAIHNAGFEAIRSMSLGDWRSQYLLSVVATALQFTSFHSVGDEGRWWFFRLAGNAGGEFLRRHDKYLPEQAVTLRRPVSWPELRPATVDAPVARLDDSSLSSLAVLLAELSPEALRQAYAEMVETPNAVTQPNWQDMPAVISSIERDGDPWAGIAPLLVYAERLAHSVSGSLRLRLHAWITEVGARHYPEGRLRDLCLAVSRHFADELVVSPGQLVGQSKGSSTVSTQTSHPPGGSTVLAPSSVSLTPPETAGAAPRPIRGGLPPKNPDFTGRKQLLVRLAQTLLTSSAVSVVPQALHGLGGVGKTQLATEYAYRHADDYWLVWWMTGETAAQVRGSLTQLAHRLGMPAGQDMKQTTSLVLEALSASPFKWLLVYDNVESPEVLTDLVPSTGVGHVIVTSRNNAAWSVRGNAIEVDVFERAESIQLLLRHGRSIDHVDADRLADKLGDLPLALEQAATWHASTGMPVTEYLELFDANIEELLSEGKPVDYPQTVYAFLKLAVHRLRDESPAAAQLLELFAFLGPEPVSVTLLRAGRGGGLSDDLKAALNRPIELNRAIREVRRFGLARVDEGQRIQVHRLIQRVLKEELIQPRLKQSRDNAQRMLAAANPGYPDEQTNWPVHAEIAAHVSAAQLVEASEYAARMVVVDQIRYFFVIGDYEASRHLGEIVVAKWTDPDEPTSPGPDHELTLIAQRHLANAYRLLGETGKARKLDTDTFDRLRRDPRFGEDHEHTLYTANNLGVDLRLEGLLADALRVEEDNVARHLRVMGPDDEATWRAENNLAVSLRHLGRFSEALPLDEKILEERRKQAGEGDSRTLFSVANVARDYYGLGKYLQALELMRTAVLPQYRELLGPRHRDLLLATRTLTMALRKCGFYAEARDNARENYFDHHHRFGPKHEHTLAATISYANALRCCGSLAEITDARAKLREATDAYREVFSEKHPLTLASTVNLALTLRAAGDREEAWRLDESALAGLTAQVGEKHPYTLAAAINLAEDLAVAGLPERAAPLSWSTYQLSIEVRGAEHPDTLACAINAALDKVAIGDESGQPLFDQTLKAMGRVLGNDHPATLDAVRGRRTECDIEPPPT